MEPALHEDFAPNIDDLGFDAENEQETSVEVEDMPTSDDMNLSPCSDELDPNPSSEGLGSGSGSSLSNFSDLNNDRGQDHSVDSSTFSSGSFNSSRSSESSSEEGSSPNGDYSASMEEDDDDHISYTAQGNMCGIQARLVSLVLNKQWEELRTELARAHRQRLWPVDDEGSPLNPTFDDNGCTAFHYLCWSPHSPKDIVESMAVLYRVGQPDILDQPVYRKFSPSDLRLFPLNPAGKMSPIHLACYNGCPSTVDALLQLKADENLALIDAIVKYSKHDRIMIEFALEGDHGCGMNPLEATWEPFFRDKSRRKNFDRLHSEADMDTETLKIWEKTKILLKATSMVPANAQPPLNETRRYLPIHSIASMNSGGEVRRLVLQLVLRIFSDELKERDFEGNLPLHSACKVPGRENPLIHNGKEFKTPVELLVEAYPDAAQTVNDQGRLPLHLAAENHKSWDEIKLLVDAAPTALQSRDPHTLMFPFMLAAVKSWKDANYRRHFEFDLDQRRDVEYFLVPVVQNDAESINTRPELDCIYNLLRGEPNIVACGISNNPYESYLIRQVKRLEECVVKLQREQREMRAILVEKEQKLNVAQLQAEAVKRGLNDRISSLEEQLRKRKRENDENDSQ
mmetsp:Transcript_7373/g.14759  ORF Transcript_7373/g.14759 Transcript_7373/m.14759 type:complete len:627 (+) Transcript_7373:179-2059(+)